jgi:FkbM family methyltransferase
MTTYVLLEQEEWFEKEINFLRRFLKPGMVAIDIGANLGVYSLPMAHIVSPRGHIFSYEPGSQSRVLLKASKEINGLGNLDIVGLALSDDLKQGHLSFARSSELRALNAAGSGDGGPRSTSSRLTLKGKRSGSSMEAAIFSRVIRLW